MTSPKPPAESEPERLLNEATDRFDDAEETAELRADEVLERRPRLAAVVRIGGAVVREQGVERVGLAASGAAFWLVISAFPIAIAAVSLFGLVVSPARVAADLGTLSRGAPSSLGSLVTTQLRRVAASDHTGLSFGLGVSVFFALWSASAGVYNLDRAIRLAYGLPPQSYVEARGRAVAGAFAVVVALGLAALTVSVAVGRSPSTVIVAVWIPAVLVAITGGVAALYRFSVGSRLPARALIPGAIASALGVVASIAGFGLYVAWSRRYTAVYGVFAGAVVGMVATYLAVFAVLLGAVLNMQLLTPARRKAEAPSAETHIE
jgi:membrane protein